MCPSASHTETDDNEVILYINASKQVCSFCEEAKKFAIVAVDTEFLREKTYHPTLCLLQLGTPEATCAIDPLAEGIDLTPVKELLEDPTVTKVIHSCSQDLEVIRYALDCDVAPVFDTQVAAAFLGFRMQLGYAGLVESYTSVRLAKAESMTDWSRRPLDKEQLLYAEDDVKYLPEIYEQQMRQLVQKNRLGWLQPEMDYMVNPHRLQVRPEEAYKKLKRAASLTKKQLAVAKEVCQWREGQAMKRNVPRKWILSDEVIVELCKRTPETDERLVRIRTLESLNQQDRTQLLQAIERGIHTDPADYPEIKRKVKLSCENESIVDLMYSLLRRVSDSCGIATQMIATRDDLAEFLVDRDAPRLREGWRYEELGKKLEKLLSGEVALTVCKGKIEII